MQTTTLRTTADERFWMVANLALLVVVTVVVVGALSLG